MSDAEPLLPSEPAAPDERGNRAAKRRKPDWLLGAGEEVPEAASLDQPWRPGALHSAEVFSGERETPARPDVVTAKVTDRPTTSAGEVVLPEATDRPPTSAGEVELPEATDRPPTSAGEVLLPEATDRSPTSAGEVLLPEGADGPPTPTAEAVTAEGPDQPAAPAAKVVTPEAPNPPPAPAAVGGGAPAGPVAWKAAASSIPRLSQSPAAAIASEAPGSFRGFAQDAIDAEWAPSGSPASPVATLSAGEPPEATPREPEIPPAENAELPAPPPRRMRIPQGPVWLVAGVALAAVFTGIFFARGLKDRGASVAQIRQHPEAFDGRQVILTGEAGQAFEVAGRYVFDLYQGRDTIVVCSSSRRPVLHESVRVAGTVSVGYVNGEPRLALLEAPSAR